MIADLVGGLRDYAWFLRGNARWLSAGLLLTFSSGAGQTYFIALFAGEIRAEFALSHGGFGLLYMAATLASALTLVFLGRILDVWRVRTVARFAVVLLAAAAALMATAQHILTLALGLYLLRLFGQGMLSHIAMTAMGRWFVAERGRAVSITATGYQLGEAALPLVVVALLAHLQWRSLWWGAAVLLLCVTLPLAMRLLAVPRTPHAGDVKSEETGRQWTRMQVVRDPLFWAAITSVLAPAFIGTSVFFHQIHIAETKAWPLSVMASGFSIMAICTVLVGLISGRVIDALGSVRLLPVFLLPLGLACGLLSVVDAPGAAWGFMALLGVSYGMSSSIFGALWPELYGTRHLGAVRSVVFAGMVFSSALGPGLTGSLIDRGVAFDHQLAYLAAYCLLASVGMIAVSRRYRQALAAYNQPARMA